jgi:hypothetical protein
MKNAYPIQESDSHLRFTFFSRGPKGVIEKLVEYQEYSGSPGLFNLGFGDVRNEKFDDVVVTNNGDMEKVLSTVVSTLIEFFKVYPGSFVIITGSTPSRLRLYRILISRNLILIKTRFELFGFKETEIELFKKNIDYDGFVIKKKS